MSGMWGSKIRISIFGESHGSAIGINIDGLPSGLELDIEDIAYEMRRRAPGKSPLSTARSEDDMEILIKKADDSLYAVKTGGKGHYAFI